MVYEEALDNLRNRRPLPKPAGLNNAEKEQLARDYYANVRTNVLLFRALSNARPCFFAPACKEADYLSLKGLLLVAILGGADSVNTFSVNDTFSRTKTYDVHPGLRCLHQYCRMQLHCSWLYTCADLCFTAFHGFSDVPHSPCLHWIASWIYADMVSMYRSIFTMPPSRIISRTLRYIPSLFL